MHTYDCVIVGGGPAGLSAAIYLARYNRSAIVCDHGSGRSTTHEINENYLGFPDGVAAKELRDLGLRQAQRFGACFADGRVDAVRRDDGCFVAVADGRELRGRTMILATGVKDILPEVDGQDVQEFFGKSLFWCITCDGHKVRDSRVAIVGKTDSAATTCLQFLNFTPHLTMVTNSSQAECRISDDKAAQLAAAGIEVVHSNVRRLEGDDGMLRALELGEGERIELDFIFNQQGARPNAALAASLGVTLDEQGYVQADNEQRTNVPMLYAAGDLTKEFAHQVVTAAHEGATAGQAANYDLYRPEQRE